MGYTFLPFKEAGGGDAMEGKFCYGRANAVCDSVQGWREHGLEKMERETGLEPATSSLGNYTSNVNKRLMRSGR
jgi:hypothetical protein